MKDIKITLFYDGWSIEVDGLQYTISNEDEDLGTSTVKKLLEYLGHNVTLEEDC